MSLSPDEVVRFGHDGYLAPVPAIGASEAAGLLAELEAIERKKGGRLPPALNAKPHLLLPSLWSLVADPRIVEPVSAILGPDFVCSGSSFISKPPGSAAHVSWHQDATHWHLSSPRAVTAWIALTPSDGASGCVRFLPGSHRHALPHDHPDDRNNMLGRRERVLHAIVPDQIVDARLAPGEMSLHHPLVVHGSAPNGCERRRTGFVIRYLAANVRVTNLDRAPATPVRGQFPASFHQEVAPEGAFAREAMRRHAHVLRDLRRVIFDGAVSGD